VPEYPRDLSETLAGHTLANADLSVLKGRSVVLIGYGQSAVEYAALLNEAGTDVEIIARGVVRWYPKVLYAKTGPARHIISPHEMLALSVSTGWWLFPLYSVACLTASDFRCMSAMLPGGSKWLRLELDNGTTREVD
jgi:hypothetical protein